MLWLALHLPALPIEVFLRGCATSCSLAITGAPGNRASIVACNQEARALGLAAGMAVSAAWALVPHLEVRPRDVAAEVAALTGLARWAGQFTPVVSLCPPQSVLLEVAASTALFGGLDNLLGQVRESAAELGYSVVLACAPTPTGAWLLARAGQELKISDRTELARRLADLPVRLLDLPPATLETLSGIGVRSVGDCLRLPRDGLARRFGQTLLDTLDRALGRLPDPRPRFTPPAHFEATLELPVEVAESEALLFATRRLLTELAGFLSAAHRGVQELSLALFHADRLATRVPISLVAPIRDLAHLTQLLREHLDRLILPAPVLSITLKARETRPLPSASLPLFPRERPVTEDWPLLVERLRARLGRTAVHGIVPLAEHRPERAWRTSDPGERSDTPPHEHRPLWLLPEIRSLETQAGVPCLNGPLRLLAGPERIESGWWDGQDIARDYFVAQTRGGSRVWVFRECRNPQTWYLQGIFA